MSHVTFQFLLKDPFFLAVGVLGEGDRVSPLIRLQAFALLGCSAQLSLLHILDVSHDVVLNVTVFVLIRVYTNNGNNMMSCITGWLVVTSTRPLKTVPQSDTFF